jgi:putative Ca2+/H+ antiporter (TMEM165/GDT1 family)
MEAFAVTFLAEWGDRSQLATIGLAASGDVVGESHWRLKHRGR